VSFYERLAELERERRSFAVATVVARRAPVSSHLGDRALITAGGAMEGFVGGSCSRDIVRREALRAIASGQPRLLQIRPGATESDANAEDCIVVAMGCASEGAVDVYIEPNVPRPQLVVVGDTPVARALARVAAQIAYDVVHVVLEAELASLPALRGVRALPLERLTAYLDEAGRDAQSGMVAVVASQGHYDEEALAPLLAATPAFVGLLASRRRGAAVLGALEAQGVARERLGTIQTPVGLDIGARSAGDVAIAILAEIIRSEPAIDRDASPAGPHETAAARAGIAIDPVCGMEVETAGARHTLAHGERTVYFCCAGCRASYAAQLNAPVS
jgi:xanthine dehydrogenase accessory factor